MPLNQTTIGAGGPATSNGRVFYREALVFAAAAAAGPTQAVEVIGLDQITFWVLQTAGTLASVVPQFSMSSVDGAVAPTQEWLPFQSAVALPAGPSVPLIIHFTVACRFVRLNVVPGAGGNTIDVAITASA